MTLNQLAKLLREQLDAKGLTIYQLHMGIAGKASHQSVYNAFAAKPVKSDTLLAILDALDLSITSRKGKD